VDIWPQILPIYDAASVTEPPLPIPAQVIQGSLAPPGGSGSELHSAVGSLKVVEGFVPNEHGGFAPNSTVSITGTLDKPDLNPSSWVFEKFVVSIEHNIVTGSTTVSVDAGGDGSWQALDQPNALTFGGATQIFQTWGHYPDWISWVSIYLTPPKFPLVAALAEVLEATVKP
jgi:hypothetical protein